MFSMEVSSIYMALCGILMIVLAFNVGDSRRRDKIFIGDGDNADFNRKVRVHGNFIEYVPLALLLLVAIENSGVSKGFVHILGSVLVIARILHAIGLSRSEGPSAPRVLGTIGTWLMILVSSITLLVNMV